MGILVPYVIEQTDRGERGMDIYSRLLRDRIIFLGTPIDDAVANTVIAQLLLLTSEDAEADINMYINSPGGSVSAGLAIFDTMQYVPNDVATTCVGLAASMGSVILAGGSRGKALGPAAQHRVAAPAIARIRRLRTGCRPADSSP